LSFVVRWLPVGSACNRIEIPLLKSIYCFNAKVSKNDEDAFCQ